jgi:hypothetical protein
MSKVTLDFPSNFDGEEYLLDANFNFYQLSSDLQGVFVFVELYAASKEAVKQIPYGTPSLNHNNAFFFEARNYTNIGGGLITFERHFVETTEFTIDEENNNGQMLIEDVSLAGGKTVSRFVLEWPKQKRFLQILGSLPGRSPNLNFLFPPFWNPSRLSNAITVQYENIETLQTARANFQFKDFPIFSKSLEYVGVTPFDELSVADRNKSIAERLELIHSESALINIDKGFILETVGPTQSTPPLSLTKSTRYKKNYRLELGTRAFNIEGETFLLWDGTQPVFSEV